jgi:hypothetical protein
MWLLLKPTDECLRPLQGHVEIIHSEEEKEAVSRGTIAGTQQRRMFLYTPLMEAEQDSPIRVHDLTEIGVVRSRLCLAEQRLLPPETSGHIVYPDNRPRALHGILSAV